MAGEGGSGGGVFLLFKMERPFVSFVFILGLCRCRIMVGNLRALSFLLPPTLVLCLRTQPKRFEREKRKEKKSLISSIAFYFYTLFSVLAIHRCFLSSPPLLLPFDTGLLHFCIHFYTHPLPLSFLPFASLVFFFFSENTREVVCVGSF